MHARINRAGLGKGKQMPQFQLNYGTGEAADKFSSLDSFLQGYIEAAFFTETGYSENEDLEHASFCELAESAIVEAQEDCFEFQASAAQWLEKAREYDYDMEQAGRDFWFSRNGHGAGYFDRKIGAAAEALQELAHKQGSRDMYRGDDGMIYFS